MTITIKRIVILYGRSRKCFKTVVSFIYSYTCNTTHLLQCTVGQKKQKLAKIQIL